MLTSASDFGVLTFLFDRNENLNSVLKVTKPHFSPIPLGCTELKVLLIIAN